MAAIKKKVVFVAMSGGVDSSVAAALLQRSGFETVGVFMKNWTGPTCTAAEDFESAASAAAAIGIPIYAWNFEEEYRTRVFDYMLREYRAGRTPNPDVMCNKEIKFGAFFERALAAGADFVATGHYVRLRRETPNSKSPIPKFRLLAGADVNKDQSYFLWTLTQDKLSRCLFPIGEYTKPQVRALARKFGLPNAERKDSQGLCFVGKVEFRSFLAEYLPTKHGTVVTAVGGRAVGEHDGAHFYTVGQRRGIGIGGGMPYFIVAKDVERNILTVAAGADDPALYKSELFATDINWISGRQPRLPFQCWARIRYRQPLQECLIERQKTNNKKHGSAHCGISHVVCRFKESQRAIAPGQSIVFYNNDEMLGGGVIESSN